MASIAVIGDALVDRLDGEDLPGGAALNVAVGLAKLGEHPTLVAMLADDGAGAVVRSHAEKLGVSIAATAAPFGTAVATASRDGDTMRYVFNEAGLRRRVNPRHPAVDAADLVAISCVQLDAPTTAAIFGLRDAAARVVLDPNPRPGYLPTPAAVSEFADSLRSLAPALRLLKLGDEDAQLLYGESPHEVASWMLEAGTGAVLVTEGPSGATLHTREASFRAPIVEFEAPIADTIGAGDASFAVIVSAIANSEGEPDWQSALDRAMLVAAKTLRSPGGELQLP